jgi:hypothetical protein
MSVFNKSIIIPIGQSLSSMPIEINDNLLMAIKPPATWTTADITFKVSHDNVDYYDLYDSAGDEFTVTVVAGKFQYIKDPIAFAAFNWIKVRSGTTASPVVQAGDRQVMTLFKEDF